MNTIALFRENKHPSDEEIKRYLAGNLCRCSGYEGQMRGIKAFIAWKDEKEKTNESGK
jgi:carbon-monoxide dehydrogenase small subunit